MRSLSEETSLEIHEDMLRNYKYQLLLKVRITRRNGVRFEQHRLMSRGNGYWGKIIYNLQHHWRRRWNPVNSNSVRR